MLPLSAAFSAFTNTFSPALASASASASAYISPVLASPALATASAYISPVLASPVTRVVGTALCFSQVFPVLGFSAAGPVAGTVASSVQSAIGVVKAGSVFSLIQSFSMTSAPAVMSSTGAIIGAVFGNWSS